MTNDELKVYIEKQIQSCKERIECFEESKKLKINIDHQDILIEMQKKQLDFYKTIKKDLEVLEILKKYYKSDGWSNGGLIEFWRMTKSQLKKVREWLDNEK